MRSSIQSALLGTTPRVVSTEGAVSDSALHDDLSIATEQLHRQESDHIEMNRMLDIAVGLENLVLVAGTIDNATPQHLALIDIALGGAAAGEDISVEQMVPGLEDSAGTTVSVEGIRKIASDVWKTIVEAIKNMWESVEIFWKKMFGAVPNTIKKAEKLGERAKDAMEKTPESNTVQLEREAYALTRRGYVPKKGSDIVGFLSDLGPVVEAMYGKGGDMIADLGGKITKGLAKVDFKDATKTAEAFQALETEMAETFSKNEIAKVVTDKVKGDGRFNAGKTTRFDLGSHKSLFLTQNRDDASRTQLVVKETSTAKLSPIESATITVISPDECAEIADKCSDMLGIIQEYQTGKAVSDIKAETEKMRETTEKVEKAFKDESSSDGFDTNQMSVFRNAARAMNMNFMRWSTFPTQQVTGNVVAITRAAITAANRSLAVYK